jgi:AcrR family transcriptional regulator/DNA-binding MarR family transcriptional regulator
MAASPAVRARVSSAARNGRPASRRRVADPERDRMLEVQRRRLLTATADVVAERGLPQVTVAHIVARSNVSRRTFYDLFADREACFLATFNDAIDQLSPVVLAAWERERSWREQVRAGLTAILEFLDDKPELKSLLIVDALGAGPDALDRRANVLAQMITAIDAGREEVKPGCEPPPLTAEGTVGAVLSIVHARALARDPAPLIPLRNPLMGMIVLPYLGASAARGELTRPVPAPRRRSHTPHRDLLHGLDMRLTYRTVRVLSAIATHPSASNRQIATGAGISDQGQISKLLHRLNTLGLIHNTTPDTKGHPNAWTLTPHGAQIEQNLRTERAAL